MRLSAPLFYCASRRAGLVPVIGTGARCLTAPFFSPIPLLPLTRGKYREFPFSPPPPLLPTQIDGGCYFIFPFAYSSSRDVKARTGNALFPGRSSPEVPSFLSFPTARANCFSPLCLAGRVIEAKVFYPLRDIERRPLSPSLLYHPAKRRRNRLSFFIFGASASPFFFFF